jgi:hypothetical protein
MGGIAKENPIPKIKIEKKYAFPRETEANAFAPKSFPTIILSNKFTETCPTCVSITGSANFRVSCVNFLSKISF